MILHSAGDIESYPLYTSAPCIAVQFCSESSNRLTLHKSKFDMTARWGSVRAKALGPLSYIVALCCIGADGSVDQVIAVGSLKTVFLKAVETDATVFLQYRARDFGPELMGYLKSRADQAIVLLSRVDNGANRAP